MQFHYQTCLNAPPAEVFAWHESPDALLRLTPPWERVAILEGGGSLQPGSRVVLQTKLGPVPLRWVAEHTEYDPPHLFADRQLQGPFASWYHRHRFLDFGSGQTLMRDEIEYEIPMGVLGRLLGGMSVSRRLQRMFQYRHAQLAEVFGVVSHVDEGRTTNMAE